MPDVMTPRRRGPGSGHARMELNLLVFLVGISAAVAFPRYREEGIRGFMVGFVTALVLIVMGLAILICAVGALSAVREKLEKFQWVRVLAALTGHLFRMLMFIGFGAFVWMLVALRFELEHLWQDRFILVMSIATGLIFFGVHRYFRETFWGVFVHIAGGLLFGLFGSFLGLILGGDPKKGGVEGPYGHVLY